MIGKDFVDLKKVNGEKRYQKEFWGKSYFISYAGTLIQANTKKNELDNGVIRNFQRSEKQTSGSLESTDFKKSEISTSESLYIRLQEVDYIGTNENKINNKYNYTESSDT